jgi:hypothetical protein
LEQSSLTACHQSRLAASECIEKIHTLIDGNGRLTTDELLWLRWLLQLMMKIKTASFLLIRCCHLLNGTRSQTPLSPSSAGGSGIRRRSWIHRSVVIRMR